MRADLADKDLIETLVKCGQKTATIALEAGSQRLRNLINKDLTKEQIKASEINEEDELEIKTEKNKIVIEKKEG